MSSKFQWCQTSYLHDLAYWWLGWQNVKGFSLTSGLDVKYILKIVPKRLRQMKLPTQIVWKWPKINAGCAWPHQIIKQKKTSHIAFWALNHGVSSSSAVAANGKSIIICRSYSCWGASVFYAEHVGNVLWPSIAFRQWLGSEYPQITTTPKKRKVLVGI